VCFWQLVASGKVFDSTTSEDGSKEAVEFVVGKGEVKAH